MLSSSSKPYPILRVATHEDAIQAIMLMKQPKAWASLILQLVTAFVGHGMKRTQKHM
jgi:hypothetical protein